MSLDSLDTSNMGSTDGEWSDLSPERVPRSTPSRIGGGGGKRKRGDGDGEQKDAWQRQQQVSCFGAVESRVDPQMLCPILLLLLYYSYHAVGIQATVRCCR